MNRDLAARQAALVAALVAGAPPPDGFDPRLLAAARAALSRKRAHEVARSWPLLVAGLGSDWPAAFTSWASGRPPAGGLRDGWDFARELAGATGLPPPADAELAGREVGWRYRGDGPPRRRRAPAVRRVGGAVAAQIAGRVFVVRARPGGPRTPLRSPHQDYCG